MTDHDNVKTILDAGAGLAAKVQDIAGIPCIVTPTGAAPLSSVVDIADARAAAPRRRKGTAQHQAIASFCEHVNRFKSAASAVWADGAKRQFIAVLNYHPAGADASPAWGDHRAVYPCPLSPEWAEWGAGEEKPFGQDGFALFLDRHDQDLAAGVVSPAGTPYASPAELVTLAASLEAYSHKTTKRERTVGGVCLTFTADSGVNRGVDIPRAFAIRIPVFVDLAPAAYEVRLRVEVADGAPVFKIQIHDAPKVLRAAFDALAGVVREATGLPVFAGTPE